MMPHARGQEYSNATQALNAFSRWVHILAACCISTTQTLSKDQSQVGNSCISFKFSWGHSEVIPNCQWETYLEWILGLVQKWFKIRLSESIFKLILINYWITSVFIKIKYKKIIIGFKIINYVYKWAESFSNMILKLGGRDSSVGKSSASHAGDLVSNSGGGLTWVTQCMYERGRDYQL